MRDTATSFREVQDTGDLARLEAAMRALSGDLAEAYAADSATLARAVLGAQPSAWGLLASQAAQTTGAALYSPAFSTVRGAAGVYVSDLWVSGAVRGQGLGTAMLAQVAQAGAVRWGATWLKLAVYDHSHSAQRFYRRLGFEPATGMQELRLGPGAVHALIERIA